MLPATSTGVPVGRAAQVGFTLIEALVAAFILAIGVLGVVSLLTMAKVSQHEGMDRVRAVALADDMVERVRRNPGAMAVYDVGLNAPIGGGTVSTEPTPDCNSAACDATELATHDLWAWEQLLDGRATTYDDGGTATAAVALRSVQGCIEFTADAGKVNTGIVDVVIQWQGLKETADAVAGGAVCGAANAEDKTRRQVVVSGYVIDETEL